jgi:hypothetical protein
MQAPAFIFEEKIGETRMMEVAKSLGGKYNVKL